MSIVHMQNFFRFVQLIFVFMMTSCSQTFKKTGSGLDFTIIEGHRRGIPATSGSTVKLQATWLWHDTLVRTTFNSLPHYQQLIPGLLMPYDPFEALLYGAREGDSVVVKLRVDSLLSKGRLQQPPPHAKPNDAWTVGIRVLKVYPFNPLETAKTDSLIAADKLQAWKLFDSLEQKRGPRRIEAYIRKKGIDATRQENGVYVARMKSPELHVERVTGSASVQPRKRDTGKPFHLLYTIQNLSGRTIISNRDTSFHQPSPLVFEPGRYFPPAIDSVIALLPEHGHWRLYVPYRQTRLPGVPDPAPLVEDWVVDVERVEQGSDGK